MDMVTFKDGPTVRMDAWLLAIDLDLRGLRMVADGSSLRVLGPNGKPDLSLEDRVAIAAAKFHLLAIVEYCAVDH